MRVHKLQDMPNMKQQYILKCLESEFDIKRGTQYVFEP